MMMIIMLCMCIKFYKRIFTIIIPLQKNDKKKLKLRLHNEIISSKLCIHYKRNKFLKCKIIVEKCQAFIISFKHKNTPPSLFVNLFLMQLLHKFMKKKIH